MSTKELRTILGVRGGTIQPPEIYKKFEEKYIKEMAPKLAECDRKLRRSAELISNTILH
jgi:hypothetical protein